MTITTAARHVDIDRTHCAAICREIGQRLDRELKKEPAQASPELDRLLARLRQLDPQQERH